MMKLESGMADSSDRPRIVIVGEGFGGFHCARALDRRLGSTAELILVNPVDHTVYAALLPAVVDPRCVGTPLAASLPSTRVLIGAVTAVDIAARTCTVRAVDGRRHVRIRKREVDVRLGTAVAEVAPGHVRLATAEIVAARTVVWTAGVTPPPIISQLDLPVERGRLVVDDQLRTPDHPHVFAIGDAAAVTDVTRHCQLAAQTAQHAQRQGLAVARNVVASLGRGNARAYEHRDLGFAVDLTGRNAVATPLSMRLSRMPAKLAGRVYHLRGLPSGRVRVLSDWVNAAIGERQIVEVGVVDERYATIQSEATGGSTIRAVRTVDPSAA
jgi:NADH dehydrogenase FAD-containing subunit